MAPERAALASWVDEVARRTKPSRVVWCDGSEAEYQSLITLMLKEGTLIELNQREYPGSYLHRSNPNDVARTEASTFICTPQKVDAGPTNNWMNDAEANVLLWKVFDGCMAGQAMYVVPYLMGQVGSPYAQVGVELTDSPYVVASLRIMTVMGAEALRHLGEGGGFVKGVHSMGTLDPTRKYVCHFPRERLIMSINSDYGGNALLSKKCHALRIASAAARDEGWLAEHMLIVGVEDPSGGVTYLTGAFPSASGKTNLAMMRPSPRVPGFKIWTVGDDIAWLHLEKDGRLHAINPEVGFFCVAPGTSPETNPNLLETIRRNTLFTNVALTPDGLPWWEGKGPPVAGMVDWQGRPWRPEGERAAHPNSRFTTPISQYPSLSPRAHDPRGVPVSAIIFGGRRSELVPLVFESFGWAHGVLVGAMMDVETTAALEGKVGVVRHDPMAMLPFCGYNMGDYFRHWLSFAQRSKKLPRIFHVNWFRKGRDKKFLWPGYRENIRVLKWIIERVGGGGGAVETPIGYVPATDSLDLRGLDVPRSTLEELLQVDAQGWLKELKDSEEFFSTLGDRMPAELWSEVRKLRERLLREGGSA